MANHNFAPELRILITGFGNYRQFKDNPSWKLTCRLPSIISHRGITIQVLRPKEAMKAEYHHIISTIPTLIEEFRPDAIISLGQDELAKDFKIEKGARRDVYYECPDNARKTLTRKETQALWPGCGEKLETEMDVESLLRGWKRNLGKELKGADLGISEDAGSFVCGLLYYAVLAHVKQKGKKAVFMHVPPLKTEGELKMGNAVMEALIKAVAEGCEV